MATEHAFPDATAKTAANFPKEFDPEKMSISMGPSHPSTHGVLRIQFELDGETVTKAQMVMEGLSAKDCGVQFHVACFYVWDAERRVLGHEPSAPA